MKFASLMFAILLPLAAQEIKMPPSLDRLADKAAQVVDVSMDASLLQLAARFLSDKDPDESRVKKLVGGLKGIYVKSFEFESRGEYQDSDVEPLRAQLRAPGWSRMVGVRSKRSGDNAEVFLKTDGGQVSGLAVIIADPMELTIVSIIGSVNPEQIRDLGGHFGIPRLEGGAGIIRKSNPGKEN